MYSAFSQVYDRLMANVDYAGWAAHYQRLMADAGVPAHGKCVECACGTGSLTVPMQKAGYKMTGVDLSEDMLALAMEKARREGLMIPFIRQDMAALTVPRKADCVLATCDGVNYLTEPKKVLDFFRAAHAALREGGALIFDVSTPEKLQSTLGGNTLFSDDEEISFIWRNRYDPEKALVRMRLSLFVRREDGAYDRMEESQLQRAHSREEITQWLKEAGFTDICFRGRQRMTPPRAGDDRWHITAKKAAGQGGI